MSASAHIAHAHITLSFPQLAFCLFIACMCIYCMYVHVNLGTYMSPQACGTSEGILVMILLL